MQVAARLTRRLKHLFGIDIGAGHRLFTEDILAGLQCSDRHRRMEVVVQTDIDGLNVIALEQLTKIAVDIRDIILLCYPLRLSFIDIRHRHHFRISNLAIVA